MKIRCFLLGCRWDSGVECMLGGERILWHSCTSCPSHRYVAA